LAKNSVKTKRKQNIGRTWPTRETIIMIVSPLASQLVKQELTLLRREARQMGDFKSCRNRRGGKKNATQAQRHVRLERKLAHFEIDAVRTLEIGSTSGVLFGFATLYLCNYETPILDNTRIVCANDVGIRGGAGRWVSNIGEIWKSKFLVPLP
jgi:hypothetical protein